MDKSIENNTECCVPQCSLKGTINITASFHRFPLVVDMEDKNANPVWVCSQHFKKTVFILPDGSPDKSQSNRIEIPSMCPPLSSNENTGELKQIEAKCVGRNKSRMNCCVPRCSSLKMRDKELTFHRFPREVIRRKKWLLALRIGKEIGSRMTVCSKHFQPFDFFPPGPKKKQRKLKMGVVPSQNLPAPPSDILIQLNKKPVSEVSQLASKVSQSASKVSQSEGSCRVHCCVPGCTSIKMKDNGLTFHWFPKDVMLKEKWLLALKMEKEIISSRITVCSRHFKPYDFFAPGPKTKRRSLKRRVIPSQNLPDSPSDILVELEKQPISSEKGSCRTRPQVIHFEEWMQKEANRYIKPRRLPVSRIMRYIPPSPLQLSCPEYP